MNELELLYEEHIDKVFKFFYVHCLDRHLAEDLTSQTFVACIDKLQNEHEIKDKKKYLFAIMRNVWANYLRDKYASIVDSVENIEDFEQHTEKTVAAYEEKDLHGRAAKYIDRLPIRQKEVAQLRFLEGLSVSEVAERLGKNKLYIKTTQYRAVKRLKEMLAHPETEGTIT